jgi:hypothetical protein
VTRDINVTNDATSERLLKAIITRDENTRTNLKRKLTND